jgi:hypothetical protein
MDISMTANKSSNTSSYIFPDRRPPQLRKHGALNGKKCGMERSPARIIAWSAVMSPYRSAKKQKRAHLGRGEKVKCHL